MRIDQLLNSGKITFSCEIFPPKKEMDLEQVRKVATEICSLKPDFMSVTYGAGGSSSKRTIDIASDIQNNHGVPALAHMTCVSSTKEQISDMLDELRKNKIENILALRGDIPTNMDFPLSGQYRYANELIKDLNSQNEFCIGAACYPDGHVECDHKEDDIDHLKRKVECGCHFLTTQMFFDNAVFYNFLYRILKKDIRIPVVAGIMPVTNSKQIKRSCQLSGTELPPRFKSMADKFGDNPAAMKQAGIAYATEQIIDLISNGVNHIHLYTMNKPDIAREIMTNLSAILRTSTIEEAPHGN